MTEDTAQPDSDTLRADAKHARKEADILLGMILALAANREDRRSISAKVILSSPQTRAVDSPRHAACRAMTSAIPPGRDSSSREIAASPFNMAISHAP